MAFTERNLTQEIPTEEASPLPSETQEPIPPDSELEELAMMDMVHFGDVENPLVLDDDFFQDS